MPLNHEVPFLQAKNLKRYYFAKSGTFSHSSGEVRAADGVSFSLYKDEALGLAGESGCDKSTLGHQTVGLERPTGSKALYQGKDPVNISAGQIRPIHTQPQTVFQGSYSPLNPRRRTYEIPSEPMLCRELADESAIHREMERLLDMVGFPRNALGRYPYEFSDGQRQRIDIARAFSLKPQLLICDEPVNALDVLTQIWIPSLLKGLQRGLNLTYIFTGHGLGAANYVSDRIAVMYLGQIVELVDNQELFKHPQHPYSKALFDAVPLVDPRTRKRCGKGIIKGETESETEPMDRCSFYPRCPHRTGECAGVNMVPRSTPAGSRHLVSYIRTIRGGGCVIQEGMS